METTKKGVEQLSKPTDQDFVGKLWEESWAYIKTVVDVVREPVLILDKNLRVMDANAPFFQTFQVDPSDTKKKLVYELGNGQWNIPALRKLLEDILPKNTFFKGFEVDHDFPLIGHKVMILNARQIHFQFKTESLDGDKFPSIILLAIEDVTDMMVLAKTIAIHTQQLEIGLNNRTSNLEIRIAKMKKDINSLQKKAK